MLEVLQTMAAVAVHRCTAPFALQALAPVLEAGEPACGCRHPSSAVSRLGAHERLAARVLLGVCDQAPAIHLPAPAVYRSGSALR